MIEVKITEEMKERAKKKSEEMGVIRNSIMSGDGNIAGFLGEEIANTILQGKISNTYDYDIITGQDQWREAGDPDPVVTWDVKTKRCTSPPKKYYECSIADFNTKQKCDNYAFVRIEFKNDKPTGRAWFLGGYIKKNYFRDARFLKKGDYDPDNNYTVKADCYNLPINKLYQKEL